jgi:hypothetical protein
VPPTSPTAIWVDLSATIEHLNNAIGSASVEQRVRVGATMDRHAATLYALSEIEQARHEQSRGE